MKTLTCIVCPKGCTLQVDAPGGVVTGHGCSRGRDYGLAEVTNPTRMLTTTVAIDGAIQARLPVKTSAPIPREALREAMQLVADIRVQSPVTRGTVLYSNLLNTGADLIACADL